jgi:5S rRNA maturation endonuclease (ribonuclease M5)
MSNETKQTAVEQFAIALYEGGYLQGNGDEIQKLLEQYLEMEKEQMIDFAEMARIKTDGSFYDIKGLYDETYMEATNEQ